MPNAGEILKKFYPAVAKKDIAMARSYLNDDLLFLGLFDTYLNPQRIYCGPDQAVTSRSAAGRKENHCGRG
jgi:hypothetical protein